MHHRVYVVCNVSRLLQQARCSTLLVYLVEASVRVRGGLAEVENLDSSASVCHSQHMMMWRHVLTHLSYGMFSDVKLACVESIDCYRASLQAV